MKTPASLFGKKIIYKDMVGTGVFDRFNTGTDISMKFHSDNTYTFKQVGDKRTGASASFVYKKIDENRGKIINIINSRKEGLQGCLMEINLNFKTGKGYTKVLMHTGRKNVKEDRLKYNFELK